MKKFALPIIANIIAFACVPIACSFLDTETLRQIWVLIIVIGNSAYFFVQSNIYARYNKNIAEIFVINIITMLLYMHIYLGEITLTFLIFYTVMMILGLRDGNNRLKYREQLKQLATANEEKTDLN